MPSENLIVKRILSSLPDAVDVKVQHLVSSGGTELDLLFLDSTIDHQLYYKFVCLPFIESQSVQQFTGKLTVFGAKKLEVISGILDEMLQGGVVMVHFEEVYSLNIKKVWNDSPGNTQTENTVLGANTSFSEDLHTNLSIIRSKYTQKELTSEAFTVGTLTNTEILLVYDGKLAKPAIVGQIRQKLSSVKIDVLEAAGQLERFLNNQRFALFPTMMITERPDRVVLNLAHGKIAIFIQGTPFVLLLPAVFFDFMSAMDDLYQPFWVSRSLVVLRYVSLFVTLLLPALYVSIVSYNPEIVRVQLALSIAGSRSAVPYPSVVEVIIMLFMIEALVEASLRLPKFIGSTATTVGGLILGQSAQQAGLVSSIMIIITSAVAISNFVIPINPMSFAMRIAKYVLIVLASFFGIVGTLVGLFFMVGYLASMRSFEEPYLKMYVGERSVASSSSESEVDAR